MFNPSLVNWNCLEIQMINRAPTRMLIRFNYNRPRKRNVTNYRSFGFFLMIPEDKGYEVLNCFTSCVSKITVRFGWEYKIILLTITATPIQCLIAEAETIGSFVTKITSNSKFPCQKKWRELMIRKGFRRPGKWGKNIL